MEYLLVLNEFISPEIQAEIAKWFGVVTSFIGTFAVLAAATKTKRDDKIVGKVVKIVDLFGANVGNAKNAK